MFYISETEICDACRTRHETNWETFETKADLISHLEDAEFDSDKIIKVFDKKTKEVLAHIDSQEDVENFKNKLK